MPKVNDATVALVKKFEGCSLTSYQDAVGVWTIGYGHTYGVGPHLEISQDEAETFLQQDLAVFARGVNNLCEINLNPNQFGALVSFAYNLGLGALHSSTLMRYVNLSRFDAAKKQFGLWVYADGRRLEGLVRRRAAEAELFDTPVTP